MVRAGSWPGHFFVLGRGGGRFGHRGRGDFSRGQGLSVGGLPVPVHRPEQSGEEAVEPGPLGFGERRVVWNGWDVHGIPRLPSLLECVFSHRGTEPQRGFSFSKVVALSVASTVRKIRRHCGSVSLWPFNSSGCHRSAVLRTGRGDHDLLTRSSVQPVAGLRGLAAGTSRLARRPACRAGGRRWPPRPGLRIVP